MDNQTEELWLAGVAESDRGAGLFVFPSKLAAEFGQTMWSRTFDSDRYGPLTKAIRADLTYPSCVQQGSRDWVIAFKWIPNSIAPIETVVAAAQACKAVFCVRRCAGYGCACTAGFCK